MATGVNVSKSNLYAVLDLPHGPIPPGIPAINTLLRMANAGYPLVYTVIANVGDMDGLSLGAEPVDVTSHAESWDREIGTLLDDGDLVLPLYFIPSSPGPDGHDATNGLLSVFLMRETRHFSLTFPDEQATTYFFQACISQFDFTEVIAGAVTAEITFVCTDEPVLT